MNSLTDRYLAATLRAVPADRREEIAAELRASIGDMVSDRTAGGQDPDAAEREVLTELGNPDRLAAGYADRRLQLIGPAWYLAWQRLLRTLLTFVPAIAGTVTAVATATGGGTVGNAITSGLGTAFQVAVQIAFWVTLTFAVIERTTPDLRLPAWSVDQLPDAPVQRHVPLGDTLASVVMLLLVIAFLPWQHFHSWVTDDTGDRIPVVDPALWSSWLPVIVAVLLGSVVLEIVVYRTGRWTWPLVAVNAGLNLAFAAPTAWLLLTDRLFDPALVQHVDWLRENGRTAATTGVVVLAVIMLWDVTESVVKARRHASSR